MTTKIDILIDIYSDFDKEINFTETLIVVHEQQSVYSLIQC